ncbi:hypothetical protein GCM10023188_21320 [Pontibacter saemangeumensis]|uniref:Gluconate 2-dehydrogenase subunit 3 n=1 Tax=Pontibacter saemangeumensis TaxID=1084525 RepID=A0ABP8LNF9_9BACT
MKRRAFLLYSLSATVLALPVAGCLDRKPMEALAEPQVLMRLCDAPTIQKIGEAYRAKVPAESGKEALTERLLEASSGNPLPTKTDNNALHAFLSNKIKQDFEAGRIVTLLGWMLSETEARQCALFSLKSS